MEEEKLANARFDRMEQHLSLIKNRNIEISEDVSQIKSAIVGNTYSGGKGLIHTMQEVTKRMDDTEDAIALLKENMNILKWIARTVGALLLALIISMITK